MDYQIHDGLSKLKLEMRNVSAELQKSSSRSLRLAVPKAKENSIRVIPHNGALHIKYISDTTDIIKINVPDTIREIEIIKGNGSFMAMELNLDSLSISSRGDIELSDVTVYKRCGISTDESSVKLRNCDISSMSLQINGGALETENIVLHGNNTAYVTNCTVYGTFKGALAEYVISAGSGISTDEIIVNDHRLTEFPDRKNVQNCAWLLIAGSLKETAHIKISKPRYINGY
ncbi:MAG: DUF4097 family beta strand repeat-containing protein [Ruminococcus sp.]